MNRAIITQAFRTLNWEMFLGAECKTVIPTVDTSSLVILAAAILRWPMNSVKAVEQVGRFVKVLYDPVDGNDPDMIICIDPALGMFNQAMADFQNERRDRFMDVRAWYTKMVEEAKKLAQLMYSMQATGDEIIYVIKWALMIASTCDRLNDGIRDSEISSVEDYGGLAPWSGWVGSE